MLGQNTRQHRTSFLTAVFVIRCQKNDVLALPRAFATGIDQLRLGEAGKHKCGDNGEDFHSPFTLATNGYGSRQDFDHFFQALEHARTRAGEVETHIARHTEKRAIREE